MFYHLLKTFLFDHRPNENSVQSLMYAKEEVLQHGFNPPIYNTSSEGKYSSKLGMLEKACSTVEPIIPQKSKFLVNK